MVALRLKDWMPRSLYWRATLILMVPVLTIMLMVTIVFFQRFYEDVTQQMTSSVVAEIRLVLDRLEDTPDAASALEIAAPLGIEIGQADRLAGDRREWSDITGRTIISVLKENLPNVTAVDLAERRGFALVELSTRSGYIVLDIPRRRLSARNPHQFLVLIGFTALLMSVIALLYLRNQMLPIRRLALAAEAFGKGRVVPYRPAGATEVRSAGAAFLDMRDRIDRQIDQRTMMLSGVSHDLKTPLTRMKLALSLMEDNDDTRAMLRDVQDMESMLEGFLAFAKGDSLDEPTRTDPLALAREVLEQTSRSHPVSEGHFSGQGTAMLRPIALKRAIENLVMNAVRYGNEARLSAEVLPNSINFAVEDSGPGIPLEKREFVLRPFVRLDAARNQNTGSGVGLGLSIAADIARQHGGALIIGDSHDLGGARIEISIPR